MADDYLSDREQEEALLEWWRENWRWIIGGIALGLAMLIGWRSWEAQRESRAHDASRDYAQFQTALERRDVEQAERLLLDLVSDHGSSAYVQQGRLMLAKAQVEAGNFDQAITLLTAAADASKDKELSSIARLRVARLLIQQGKYDPALALLKVDQAGAFAAQTREIRGDAMMAKGEPEAARAEYAAALSAASTAGQAQIDPALLQLKLQDAGGGAGAAGAGAGSQGQP
jgi:predicted negative regulator of RcsB-dependent stress response